MSDFPLHASSHTIMRFHIISVFERRRRVSDLKNKELNEKIGEQKIVLEKIVKLLAFYKDSDQHMASLLSDLESLKLIYDKVNIIYTYKESTFEVVDGVMVIKDNSTTTVEITPEQVTEIKTISSSIRNKIIS